MELAGTSYILIFPPEILPWASIRWTILSKGSPNSVTVT